MRISLFIFVFSLFLFSCSSENLPDAPDTMSDIISYSGDFVSVAHPTMGKVTVDQNKSILSIENFKSDDGPVLEMYLATNTNATTFISLGDLKGLEGNYEYNLPENVDLDTYKFVMVWCVDFSVNFGHAELTKN